MGKIIRYFKGVGKEIHRVRWPKKNDFFPAVITVLVIAVFFALWLLVEDLAAGTLISQLKEAFKSLRG